MVEHEFPCRRGAVVLVLTLSLLLLAPALAGVNSGGPRQPASTRAEGSTGPSAGLSDHEKACTHVVRRGESLSRIAARYGTTRPALVKTNRLAHSATLRVGQRLKVPGCAAARRASPSASASVDGDGFPGRTDSVRGAPASSGRPASPSHRLAFAWPVHGTLTSGFGPRGFWHWHTGVDIKAERGTPIRAAAPGTVVFSGRESSYGEVVKIAHADGFSTLYAHNRRNFVKVGDRVTAGTVIAAVGRTGDATGYHVHFEIRRRGLPQNPLALLERRELGPTVVAKRDSEAPISPVTVSTASSR
jgi:murein DD-endopeptidase MepM/ murein hydrolase activator NlpD